MIHFGTGGWREIIGDKFTGFSTLQNYIKLYKPQKCGIFLSNFLNFFVVWCCILIKSVI